MTSNEALQRWYKNLLDDSIPASDKITDYFHDYPATPESNVYLEYDAVFRDPNIRFRKGERVDLSVGDVREVLEAADDTDAEGVTHFCVIESNLPELLEDES
jgi:hypothetical protein